MAALPPASAQRLMRACHPSLGMLRCLASCDGSANICAVWQEANPSSGPAEPAMAAANVDGHHTILQQASCAAQSLRMLSRGGGIADCASLVSSVFTLSIAEQLGSSLLAAIHVISKVCIHACSTTSVSPSGWRSCTRRAWGKCQGVKPAFALLPAKAYHVDCMRVESWALPMHALGVACAWRRSCSSSPDPRRFATHTFRAPSGQASRRQCTAHGPSIVTPPCGPSCWQSCRPGHI